MSLFSVGGNIGFALGPVLVTPLVLIFGLHGTLLMIIPTWLMAAVLVFELPRLRSFRADLVGGRVQPSNAKDHWGPFAVLGLVIALRSFVYFGLVTFIPLYYVHDLHTSKAMGSAALSVMLVGGAVGTLVGGRLADRFGRRTVLRASMIVLPPLIVGFLASGPVPAMVFAGLAGAATIATFAVTIVMGQEYLPGRIGMASGVTIGLSIGLGGVGAPLLGLLADAHGLRAVFELVAVFPLVALVLAQTLPASAPAAEPGPRGAPEVSDQHQPRVAAGRPEATSAGHTRQETGPPRRSRRAPAR
jgi:FSR family fosmidomycin resistance protein-like MFS transporter